MSQTTLTSQDRVNEWLASLNADPATEDSGLNDQGMALVTRDDGVELVLRLVDEVLSLFIMVVEVPPDAPPAAFQTALNMNLYPSIVGGGHFAYDTVSHKLTYCMHLAMEFLAEDRFQAAVENMFNVTDELRGNFPGPPTVATE